jgi:PLD-like domain
MADFLTTSEINSSIERIIRNAKQHIVLISPYIQISDSFVERINEAIKAKVKVELVFGKESPSEQQLEILSTMKGLQIKFLEHLHAKCYYNEELMVISSMNFFDYSAKHNFEMGILINRQTDGVLYESARKEAEFIIGKSDIVEIEMACENSGNSQGKHASFDDAGCCIRCGISVAFNPLKPLCKNCYNAWSVYGNPDYEENYCHSCGDDAKTSVTIPECRECYQINKKRRAI